MPKLSDTLAAAVAEAARIEAENVRLDAELTVSATALANKNAELAALTAANAATVRELGVVRAERDVLAEENEELRRRLNPPAKWRLGVNLDEINAHNRLKAFDNVILSAQRWEKPGGGPARLGPNAMPAEPAKSHHVLNGGYPHGTYTAQWRGKAKVTFSVKGRNAGPPALSEFGFWHMPVTVGPGGHLQVNIADIDPADPITDLRLLTPGETGPFTAAFLARLVPLNGPLRFMDWAAINRHPPGGWATRTPPTDAVQSDEYGRPKKPVAWEYCIELCNAAGKDLWLCVPDTYGPADVGKLAELVAGRLDRKLRAYLEHVNERWNFGFDPWSRLKAAALADPRTTAGAQDYIRVAELSALRDVENARAFRQALGRDRVFPVFGCHTANPAWAEAGLKAVARVYGDPAADLWALACTSYVGLADEFDAEPNGTFADGRPKFKAKARTADEYFDALLARTGETWGKCVRHREIADAARLPGRVVVYEGGMHLNDRNGLVNGDVNKPEKEAARFHPRGAEFIDALLAQSERHYGKGVFCHFTLAGPGWGLLPSLEKDHPKYAAYVAAAAKATA